LKVNQKEKLPMFLRKYVSVAALLLISALIMSACTVGPGVTVPTRDVSVSNEAALEAQNLAMAGLMMGSVDLNEEQFSSLLTELMRANTGQNNPVEEIRAWFEPDMIYLQAELQQGVLPAAFGNTLTLAGNLTVQDGRLLISFREAAAGNYVVAGAALDPINNQINMALASQGLMVPATVTMESGVLTIELAQ
jgi:hypothetical protein